MHLTEAFHLCAQILRGVTDLLFEVTLIFNKNADKVRINFWLLLIIINRLFVFFMHLRIKDNKKL